MSDVLIKDYRTYNLDKRYGELSYLLHRLSQHVMILSENIVINVTVKNINLSKINNIIKSLNATYNNNIMSICGSNSEKKTLNTTLFESDKINKQLYDDYYNFNEKLKINGIENEILDDGQTFEHFYDNIKKEILEVCANIGFHNLDDAMCLLVGKQYRCIMTKKEHNWYDIYNKLFVPFSYKIIEGPKDNLQFKKLKIEKDGLIDNCYSLYINHGEKCIVFNGYFIQDTLNVIVRTSQKRNNMIYQKKRNIDTMLKESKLHINDKFKKMYVKNSPIKDILVVNETQFVEQLEADYNRYIQLIKCSFMNLMKEFIKDNVKNMFTIIKLLLLGSDENINVAGLLYGLTRDKKVGGNTVANLIYKNLSYISQLKLVRSNITIKNELDRIKSLTVEDVDLKKQIVALKNMPDNIKSIALEKVDEMKTSNNEYYKQQLFVKTLCKFPWPSPDDDKLYEDLRKDDNKSKLFLDDIGTKLEETVYGHENAKKELKELVGKWISNPKSSGSAIGLVGPPGVGKTLFAKGISKALDIPFAQIALGGQNDGEILYGHGYTYSGSQPGMVIKKMIDAGSSRCVLYFDELDKTASKHGTTNEIMSILIHMTDPNMNSEFQDRFFQGIDFPLNKVLMVFSYNDSKLIDRILLDRLKKINIEAYTTNDKITIVKDFIIKEISETVGYEHGSVIIENKINNECFNKNGKQKPFMSKCKRKKHGKKKCTKCITNEDLDKHKNIEYIIENYTLEAGVRELKRCIEKIFLRLNIDKIYKKGPFEHTNTFSKEKPIIIDRKTIIKYLDKPQLNIEKIHQTPMIGVINGLYATSVGRGGIVPIQIYKNEADNKFILKLTGSQKEVMKESVICSLTAASNILNKDIKSSILKKFPHGFHIHTPDGATPKDGPSAGCAFTTAFASCILGKKIKNNIAMTGEIDLTGKVTKIGGLLYKLTGAKKAGVVHVYCSIENKEDYDKIIEKNKKLVCDTFQVSFVSNVREIFKQVIIGITEDDLLLCQ